eukprot:TRINITY_DN2469_c0_g1_i1.p1 TRINITY_DN2469_c0_g1~~TRINITY_DN2469_c0_g1_i1.p1  ORF type:complete len:1285 (-),score=326.57 TRINITY_DN2469_c0_g1_i1:159-4013(-)
MPHESVAKGFSGVWLGQSTNFATVGWSKGSDRQVAIWDSRKATKPCTVQTIDVSSSALSPVYDADLCVLYLVERGTKTFMYEVVKSDPWITAVGKFEAKSTQSGATMLPKRVCNVMNCEVSRWLYATSNDGVDVVSFFMPRKDKTIFQEDLFPPAECGEPAVSASEYLSGKAIVPMTKSLRPAGVKSVYELSEEDGGRSRARDQMRHLGNAPEAASDGSSAAGGKTQIFSEGNLMLAVEGFLWNSWQEAYLSIQGRTLYVFQNKDAAVPLVSIPLDVKTDTGLARPVDDEPTQLEVAVCQNGKLVGRRVFKANNSADRNSWILSINQAQEQALIAPRASEAQSSSSTSTSSSDRVTDDDSSASSNVNYHLNGYLLKYTEGYFWNSWQRQFFSVDGGVLKMQASDSATEVTESILLDKVTSIYEASNIENANFCFKIATPTRTWTLQAPDDETMQKWISTLEAVSRSLKAAKADDGDEDAADIDDDNTSSNVVEGYLSVKTGLWSMWSRQWVTGVKTEVLTFKNATSSEPTRRIPLNQVKTIDISDKDVELAFMIRMIDGTTHHFTAQVRSERDEWLSALQEMRTNMQGTVDMLDALTIDLTQLSTVQLKAIEDALKNVIDPNKVKAGGQPLLLRINAGKRFVRATCVALNLSSLNLDSILILDLGAQLIQWNGTKASRMQKAKAMDVTTRIRQKERGGNCVLHVIEQGSPEEDPSKSNPAKLFWQHVNGGKFVSQEQMNAAVLSDIEKDDIVKLYRVSDKKVSLIHQGKPPSKDRLNSKLTYVVESGPMVMVWNGKSSTKEAKKLALHTAQVLQANILKSGSSFSMVLRLMENGETTLWKECFRDYPGELPISMQRQSLVSNISGRKDQKPIDIARMHSEERPAAARTFSTAGGRVQVWRVDDYHKTPLPEALYGHFWSNQSFLIRFTYKEGNSDRVILYFWQGRGSSINEKGASAYLTKELGDENKEVESKHVRVPQGFEPTDFLAVFGNKFIVHLGPYKEKWNTVDALFGVRGSTELDSYPHEVPIKSSSLHSHHAFVLYSTKGKSFVWIGKQANDAESSRARELGASWSATTITEGNETDEFFATLGGKQGYTPNASARYQPKLFTFSGVSGTVECNQEFEVCQDALNARCVHVLDMGPSTVYVWFGASSGVQDKKIALQAAVDYVLQSKLGHNKDSTKLVVTKAGCESELFKSAFRSFITTSTNPVWEQPLSEVQKEYLRDVYSYAELISDDLPAQVDRTKLEIYLTKEEFEKLFHMTKEAYDALPHWKQLNTKKAIGLY